MELFYRKSGSGKPLVILHGLYGSSDNWMSIAGKLAGDFEVYLVDLRNHGKSPHDDRHDYESMRDDLLAFMDQAHLDSAVIAGHSMGGKAAMCFARHHAARIQRLIIIDIAPKSYKSMYRSQAPNHFDILKAMQDIDFSDVSSRRDVDRQLASTIKQARIRAFLMKNLERGDDKRYFWSLNLGVLLRELDNIMDGINEKCFDPKVPLRDFPVLFIRGENSPYVLDEDMNFIRKIFPLAALETIPDAGHWLHAEQPEAFTGLVRKFASGAGVE
jgi:esterase